MNITSVLRGVYYSALAPVVVCVFTACTEVQVVAPNPRVEPPELRGVRGWKISVSGESTHILRSTADGSARPPDLSHPQTIRSGDVVPGTTWSPSPQFEFGGEILPLGRGATLIGKWQIMGEGAQTAAIGDLPVSAYLRAGFAQGGTSGTQRETFGPGGYPWTGRLDSDFVHAGLSAGYRFHPHVLAYVGGAVGQYWAHGRIKQDASSADSGGEYKTSYTGFGDAAGVGLFFNWRVVQFFVGGEYTHIQYAQTRPMDSADLRFGLYIAPGVPKTEP